MYSKVFRFLPDSFTRIGATKVTLPLGEPLQKRTSLATTRVLIDQSSVSEGSQNVTEYGIGLHEEMETGNFDGFFLTTPRF